MKKAKKVIDKKTVVTQREDHSGILQLLYDTGRFSAFY